MKWFLIPIVILALAVPVVVAALLGARLPKRHVAASRALLRQSPESVWAVIADHASSPNWRSDLKQVERWPDRDGHEVWVEVSRQGRMPFEVVESAPPRRRVTRIADPNLPFGGSWTYEIEPATGGSTLTITEDGTIRNPIFRFMARHVFGYDGTQKRYLRDLGKKFGEEIVPERVQ